MILGIYGAGGMGREVHELAKQINRKDNRWSEIVFVDDNTSKYSEYKIRKLSEIMNEYEEIEYVIAVGEPEIRRILYQRLKMKNCKLATLIHPEVYIPESAEIGNGVIISMGCFISCNVKLHDNTLIQPHCVIAHESVIGEHSFLASSSNIAGGCIIGTKTYIGLSVCIRELVHVGDGSVVGMGSVVIRDVEDGVVVVGNPAKVKNRNENLRVFQH